MDFEPTYNVSETVGYTKIVQLIYFPLYVKNAGNGRPKISKFFTKKNVLPFHSLNSFNRLNHLLDSMYSRIFVHGRMQSFKLFT